MPAYSNDPQKLNEFALSAAAQYGFDASAKVSLLNLSENATFKIESGGAKSILRIHRPAYHTPQAIESELNWIEALQDSNLVTTPGIIRAENGSRVVTAIDSSGEKRNAVMFAFMNGVEPTEDRLVHDFVQLGEITARLHQHAKQWQKPQDFSRFTWNLETALGPNGHWGYWRTDGLAMGPSEVAILDRLVETLTRRLNAFGNGPDRFGLVHADMRLANLLVDDSNVAVIDFDDCGLSWFMYDLGSSVSFIEDSPLIPAMVDSWVQGYRKVAALSEEEVFELQTFIMFRRLLLVSWVGTHQDTETGQEMGEKFTTVTCDLAETYLSHYA
jgi:Ser/Thr protein kinase RdoA (MazF antagonist)